MRILLGIACCVALATSAVHAHEVRPAYLEMRESRPGAFHVTWKVPRVGDRVLPIRPLFPASCNEAAATTELLDGAVLEERSLDCGADEIAGQAIEIENLATTMTDVLARVEFADGRVQQSLLKPGAPSFTLGQRRALLGVARDYLSLGVEHILGGLDHLLFVLGLLLIVPGTALLLKTITSFTVAHSVTLGLAALGFVHVPQPPVEAVIALSVVFLARELVRCQHGESSFTATRPWLVAFPFGLLHGLGFAGALGEVGLPETDIPLALLSFNAGVELGQVLFVIAMLAAMAIGKHVFASMPQWLRPAPAYAIGAVASFWLIERVSGLL